MDIPFAAAVREAAALRRLGKTELWVDGSDDELPWELVCEVTPGGCIRWDINTDVNLKAPHPCGLTFKWSRRIEGQDADGSPRTAIDAKSCRNILRRLPDGVRPQFAKVLADCAAVMRKRIASMRETADGWCAQAEQFEAIAAEARGAR